MVLLFLESVRVCLVLFLKVMGTGNSTQYSGITYMGEESEKEWIYAYV